MPPLRARENDALLLFQAFAARAAQAQGLALPSLTLDDADSLLGHSWPGNVREVKALAERFAYGLVEPGGGLGRMLAGGNLQDQHSGGLIERLEAHERRLIRQRWRKRAARWRQRRPGCRFRGARSVTGWPSWG